ncbi:hypothetical protein PSPO01_13425 [Paraphaeosphaeria sporulosa]
MSQRTRTMAGPTQASGSIHPLIDIIRWSRRNQRKSPYHGYPRWAEAHTLRADRPYCSLRKVVATRMCLPRCSAAAATATQASVCITPDSTGVFAVPLVLVELHNVDSQQALSSKHRDKLAQRALRPSRKVQRSPESSSMRLCAAYHRLPFAGMSYLPRRPPPAASVLDRRSPTGRNISVHHTTCSHRSAGRLDD